MARRGMQVTRKPGTVKEDRPVRRATNKRRRKTSSRAPVMIKVTTVQPHEYVKVGKRWYTVRRVRMIGRKSDPQSICIVHTVEKGGMYFRSNSRVLRSKREPVT